MHEFIRVHLQRLNGAFGLRLPYSPSYTGLRLITQGVNPAALEAAFRQHASSSAPTPSDSLPAIAVDGKTLRGSFDAFSDRKAAHMMSALRQADQIVLGHLMVAEKSNDNSGRARADRGPRPEGLCVHARRRTRPKKSFHRWQRCMMGTDSGGKLWSTKCLVPFVPVFQHDFGCRDGLMTIHPHAGGTDVGNESHFLAVPPDRDPQPVRNLDAGRQI